MNGAVGYKAQLKLGGVPTSFTAEMEDLGNGFARIIDPVKRVISTKHDIYIEDNDPLGPVEVEDYRMNHLEGVIEFEGSPVFPLFITAYYIPLQYIGGAKDYSLEIGGDVLDDSCFHTDTVLSQGYRTKKNGLHDVSLSFSRWNNFNKKLVEAKLNKTPVFVSVNPGGYNLFIKGWYYIETDSLSGEVSGLEDESLSLTLAGDSKTDFSYVYNYTKEFALLLTEQELRKNYFHQ